MSDPKEIWQSQTPEVNTITSKLIEWKARELQAKTRRQWLGIFAGPLATVLMYGLARKAFPPLGNVLESLFTIATVWSLAGLYFLSRGIRSKMMPGDAGLATGLEFCRGELERRRRLMVRSLVWSPGPLALALGALTFAGHKGQELTRARPFLVLMLMWMIAFFMIRWRELRGMQREIDELNDLAPPAGS
jgi:hypothetical protein